MTVYAVPVAYFWRVSLISGYRKQVWTTGNSILFTTFDILL